MEVAKNILMKKYIFHLLLSVSVIILLNTFAFWAEGLAYYSRLFFFGLIGVTFLTMIVYKTNYNQIQPFISYFIIIFYLASWYFVLCIWTVIPTIFFMLFVFPLFFQSIKSSNKALKYLIACVLSIFITLLIPKEIFTVIPEKQNLNFGNIKIMISIFLIFGVIFYYNSKIIKIHDLPSGQNEIDSELNNANANRELSNDIDIKDNETYHILYNNIINYFNKETPWKDPDFSIQDLASQLNTNSTYISRSVNYHSGMNFKTLVNKYRVEFVKEELLSDQIKKRYTLFYIYTSAGFRHQSTFNKAFKQIENMTPSEYMVMLNAKILGHTQNSNT